MEKHLDLKEAKETYKQVLELAEDSKDERFNATLCETVYVDVIDIVNAAVELLVTLAESAGDKKAKKHAYSVLEKMEKTFIDYKTADRVKKLFDAGNKEFTDFATTDVKENTPIAGYTVDDFIEIINRNHLCKTKPYIFRRVSDKNRVLKINEIISLSNVIRFYFDGKINVNNLNVTLAKYGMVLADNPDVRNCNIAIYGISEKTQKLLTKFMCKNNLEFSVIEETTNNAPCKMVVKDKDNEAIVPAGMPIAECEALFKEKAEKPIDDELHKELKTLVDVAQKLIEDLKPYELEDVASEIVRVCYERFLNIKVCKNLVERIVIDSLNCKAKNLIKDLKPEYAAKEIVKMCYETLSDKDGAE